MYSLTHIIYFATVVATPFTIMISLKHKYPKRWLEVPTLPQTPNFPESHQTRDFKELSHQKFHMEWQSLLENPSAILMSLRLLLGFRKTPNMPNLTCLDLFHPDVFSSSSWWNPETSLPQGRFPCQRFEIQLKWPTQYLCCETDREEANFPACQSLRETFWDSCRNAIQCGNTCLNHFVSAVSAS